MIPRVLAGLGALFVASLAVGEEKQKVYFEPVLGRVLEVLDEKDTGLLKFKRQGEITLRPFAKAKPDEVDVHHVYPILITVRDVISINSGVAEEVLVPVQLEQRRVRNFCGTGERVPRRAAYNHSAGQVAPILSLHAGIPYKR